jgi:hypothetical protein
MKYLCLAMLLFATPSLALNVSHKGNTLYLSGGISPGDETVFDTYFNALPKGLITRVALNSGGGSVSSAYYIAKRRNYPAPFLHH